MLIFRGVTFYMFRVPSKWVALLYIAFFPNYKHANKFNNRGNEINRIKSRVNWINKIQEIKQKRMKEQYACFRYKLAIVACLLIKRTANLRHLSFVRNAVHFVQSVKNINMYGNIKSIHSQRYIYLSFSNARSVHVLRHLANSQFFFLSFKSQ